MTATPSVIDQPSCFRSGVNNSGSDIPAKRIVKRSSTAGEIELATDPTDALAGVTWTAIADGRWESYQKSEKAVVTSGAAIAAGESVTTDGEGKAVPVSQSAGAPQRVLGVAVTATSGADEDVEVELGDFGQLYTSVQRVATKAALKAVPAASRYEGLEVRVDADRSNWVFSAASSAAADGCDELVIVPTAGTGRWIRLDKAFTIKVPIGFADTDGEALLTVPAGFSFQLAGYPAYLIDTAFTGGTDSAIGLSTNITGYETKGDLIGGAAGDLLAGLTAGFRRGTIGGELDDLVGFQALLFVAGSEIQFDRIVSVFTAGAGFVLIPVTIVQAP